MTEAEMVPTISSYSKEHPPIPQSSTALVLNDMINRNLRTGNDEHDQAIAESGIIANAARLIAILRELGLPIFWIRVERRADRQDVANTLTDMFLASRRIIHPPLTHGSYDAANVDELPVLSDDHSFYKPRINPFIGTDLDLRLRTRSIDTILLGGYSTNFGVESCARTANDLGYNVVVLEDCCFNVDRASHLWSLTKIMPRFARVMSSDDAVQLLA